MKYSRDEISQSKEHLRAMLPGHVVYYVVRRRSDRSQRVDFYIIHRRGRHDEYPMWLSNHFAVILGLARVPGSKKGIMLRGMGFSAAGVATDLVRMRVGLTKPITSVEL